MNHALAAHDDDRDREPLDWNVSQCQCGQIVLECGALSLRMTRLDFARLHRLTTAAMDQFRIEESVAELGYESDALLH